MMPDPPSNTPRPAAAASDPEKLGRRFDPLRDPLCSDADMATAVAYQALTGYCWAGGLGWRRYNEAQGIWEAVPEEATIERVRRWMLIMAAGLLERTAQEISEGRDGAFYDGLATEWRKRSTAQRIAAITRLARGICLVEPARFDAHPDLLNCPNGVLDLRTAELGEHDPKLFLTKVTRARYVPGAQHRDWSKALEAIPDDAREYMQLRHGQAITGYKPPDDVVLVEIGGGENGKTTVTAGIRAALGTGYCTDVSPRVLLADESAHPTELMDLRGARIAILEETPEEHRLSMTRLKLVTSEFITARHIRQDTVTFENGCSVKVLTNYHLVVREVDHATWRRLLSLVYPFRFRKPHEQLTGPDDRRGEPGLRERIKAGRDGRAEAVLAWLAEGALRWYAGDLTAEAEDALASPEGDVDVILADPRSYQRPPMGMGEPAARLVTDTAEWRGRSDLLWAFLSEHTVFDPAAYVMATDLLTEINLWLTGHEHRKWSPELLRDRLLGHHLVAEHRVEKVRKRRTDPGLSRPPGYSAAPEAIRFQAWSGLRFRTVADDAQVSVSAGQADAGTGGTTVPGDALYWASHDDNQERLSHLSHGILQHNWPELVKSADWHAAREGRPIPANSADAAEDVAEHAVPEVSRPASLQSHHVGKRWWQPLA